MVYSYDVVNLCLFNFSIVTFNNVYVSYVIPKTGYNASQIGLTHYYFSITICLIIPKPISINVAVGSSTFVNNGTTGILSKVR